MKRIDLIRHLERHGCEFLREGDRHTVYLREPPGPEVVIGSTAWGDQRFPLPKDM
jgi:hypothetical protein